MKGVMHMMSDDELGDLRLVLHLAMHGLGACQGITCTDTGFTLGYSSRDNTLTFARIQDLVAEEIKSRCQTVKPG